MKLSAFFWCCLVVITNVNAQTTTGILSEKERATVIDDLLADRLKNLLPVLMTRAGIDTWIIISREYNEDPVIKTMLPGDWHAARRRTILVFHQPGNKG